MLLPCYFDQAGEEVDKRCVMHGGASCTICPTLQLNAAATEEKGAGSGRDEDEPWAGPTRKFKRRPNVKYTGPNRTT